MDTAFADPVDWDIDGVVQFLCHSEPRPWAEGSNFPFPKPADLAAALRDNFITGEVLLSEIDKNSLKDDLGVKPLGHRAGIMKAIEWLRIRSTKYQAKTRSSPIHDLASPRAGVSPQIPLQESPISVAPASETPLINNSEAVVAPSTTPQGKRRIAPQLVHQFEQGPFSEQNTQLSTEPTLPSNAFVSARGPFTNEAPLGTTSTAEEQSSIAEQAPLSGQLQLESPERPRHVHEGANSRPENPRSQKDQAFYDDLLRRYPPEDNEEDGLPLYGDSGSEGQFDEQTWEEMQNEANESKEHSNCLGLNEKPNLGHEERLSLISEHIAQKEALWEEKRLPRELPKAPNLWQRSHYHGSLEQDKAHLARKLSLYQNRLAKLKGGLMEVDFKDRAFFLQSCASLDPTISDICLDKWKLQILGLEDCPPRIEPPPKVPKSRKEPSNAREDESLASETDTDHEEDFEDPGSDVSQPCEYESEYFEFEIDTEPELGQVQADKPHMGLPFTLDSPPPEGEDALAEPARKKRRIHDEDTGSETSDSFLAFRLSDVDSVDMTGILHSESGPRSDVPSPPHTGTVQDAGDSDEMQIETPPLNPTPSIIPQDADVAELSVDSDLSMPARNVIPKPIMPRPSQSHHQESQQPSYGDTELPQGNTNTPDDIPSNVSEDDLRLLDSVKSLTFEAIIASKNRSKLLAKSILGLSPQEPELIQNYLDSLFLPQIVDLVHEALTQMQNNQQSMPNRDAAESLGPMRLSALYHSWHQCIYLTSKGLDKQKIKDTITHIENDEDHVSFSEFVDRLNELFTAYDFWATKPPKRHASGSHQSNLKMSASESRYNSKAMTKTKYAPRAPSNIQREAQVRQEKQEALRREREKRGFVNSDPDNQAVTFKEPTIYLHREIGKHVKPHQLRGIQFMWRELIDAERPQGCLLAHVMGLGKTMQVISLLATIADAAASTDPRVREQVPKKFHRSQTLVLCPSAVVQNWVDEFALWTPKDHHLGSIWEIMSGPTIDIEGRLNIIKTWDEKGGVLIISYDLFRMIVQNKSTRPTHRTLSDRQHEVATEALLSRPNIVIADEAHKLKNKTSAISQITSRFKTMSRIAMTGSPLANHLSEYFQMVEWVAPGYLEREATFKSKFVDPIQLGSYLDSTIQQQRESLCALKILNGILKPKVLREDTSVIVADLPPKTEFVLRIPLTNLQEQAYNTFVNSAQAGAEVDTRLYTWLAILQLCCNHPQPFLEKLADRSKEAEDIEGSVLPGSMKDSGLPTDLRSKINALFKEMPRIEDPSLSHRAGLLNRILDESIKFGDKVLIFTQSVPTLNYIDIMLSDRRLQFKRIDGSTTSVDRQNITKAFNTEPNQWILLISTKAGGVGLNMFGANRVVIFDFLFNPTWEEQAVGRAYRLGQTKPVFVYRFVAGGTFEESIFNKAEFKRQLAVRVVDKKNVVRQSRKNIPTFLFPVRPVQKNDHTEVLGKDTVLDNILAGPYGDVILDVTVSHVQDNENDLLTEAERIRVDQELRMERLKRSDPRAFEQEMKRQEIASMAQDRTLKNQRQEAFVAAKQAQQPTGQTGQVTHEPCLPVQTSTSRPQFSPFVGTTPMNRPNTVPDNPLVMRHQLGPGQAGRVDLPDSTATTTPQFRAQIEKFSHTPNSFAPGHPGSSQTPSQMMNTPTTFPLQQQSSQKKKQVPDPQGPAGITNSRAHHTTDGSADSPIEIVDLCTPSADSPSHSISGVNDAVVQLACEEDVPMDMSESISEHALAKSTS